MNQHTQDIITAVNEICKRGTKVVSFTMWNGERQNVLIGSDLATIEACDNTCFERGDTSPNPAIVIRKDGQVLLFARENNLERICWWDVSALRDFSGVPNPPSFWHKVKTFAGNLWGQMWASFGQCW